MGLPSLGRLICVGAVLRTNIHDHLGHHFTKRRAPSVQEEGRTAVFPVPKLQISLQHQGLNVTPGISECAFVRTQI